MTRREFLDATLALMVAPSALGAPPGPHAAAEVPRRRLGRSDVTVSCLGLGGAHLGKVPGEAESVRLVRRALDSGLTFLDNSWDYHGGRSEERMGRALQDGYRQKAFLMTKVDGRDRRTATAQLEESLRRLGTDHLDLLQLHEVIRDSDVTRAFAEGGAIEALLAAKQEGKTRLIGFTGHKSPAIHLRMLEAARERGVRFDTVQLPLNVMDAHYESFEQRVLPVLVREGIGVLGMKPMGDGIILRSGAVSAPDCLRYSLSLPVSVLITGIESEARLDQALRVARGFTPLTLAQVKALLARTRRAAADGAFEQYKVSQRFDSTAEHPEWMG